MVPGGFSHLHFPSFCHCNNSFCLNFSLWECCCPSNTHCTSALRQPVPNKTLNTLDTIMHQDQPTFDFLIIHDLKFEQVLWLWVSFGSSPTGSTHPARSRKSVSETPKLTFTSQYVVRREAYARHSFGVDWWVTGCSWLVRIADTQSPARATHPPFQHYSHPPSIRLSLSSHSNHGLRARRMDNRG